MKWFSEEDDTMAALRLRQSFVDGTANIVCPDLVIYEIANALRYNNSISEDDVRDAVNSILAIGITITVPTKDVVESAIDIAFRCNITFYDAYFAALAKELRYELVTADEKLYSKTKNLKFVRLLSELFR